MFHQVVYSVLSGLEAGLCWEEKTLVDGFLCVDVQVELKEELKRIIMRFYERRHV